MFHFFFNWWQGSVWGNIIASFIWTVPIYFWSKFHIRKIHKRLDYQDSENAIMHGRIKEIHNKVHERNNYGNGTY